MPPSSEYVGPRVAYPAMTGPLITGELKPSSRVVTMALPLPTAVAALVGVPRVIVLRLIVSESSFMRRKRALKKASGV